MELSYLSKRDLQARAFFESRIPDRDGGVLMDAAREVYQLPAGRARQQSEAARGVQKVLKAL